MLKHVRTTALNVNITLVRWNVNIKISPFMYTRSAVRFYQLSLEQVHYRYQTFGEKITNIERYTHSSSTRITAVRKTLKSNSVELLECATWSLVRRDKKTVIG